MDEAFSESQLNSTFLAAGGDGSLAFDRDLRRYQILAQATRILGSSLDYETTLQQVVRLALPDLADFCYVDIVDQGRICRVAAAHVDPAQEGVLRELQEDYPPGWDSPAPAARVLRAGEPELLVEVDPDVVASHTVDARHADLIRRLGVRSHIAVPMVARGEQLGAISLALTGETRRYGPEHLALAEELAHRAAIAVDHARLYRAAQQELAERRRAEEALKLHSRVLESMREGVSVTDEQGVIVYTNPAEDTMFGYAPGELLGQHVTVQNAYPAEENERVVAEVIQTLRSEGEWVGEWLNRKKDGTPFITRAQITALETDGAKFWVCVQEDVTEQRRAAEALRRSEERYRSLVAATSSIVWTSDGQGRFVERQSSWEAYTGQGWEEHRGFGWVEMIHPEDREKVLELWQRSLAERVPCEAQGRLWHAGTADYRHFAVRAIPLYHADGTLREWVGNITDIHDRVRAEWGLIEETRTVESINRIGQVLAGDLDLQKLLQALTDAATEISDAQFGSFFYSTWNEEGEALMLYTLSGAPQEAFSRFPTPRKTAIFAPTFDGTGIVRLADVTQDPRFGKNAPYYGMPEGHLPVRSYLAVPVISRTGEVLGGLFFGHALPGVFTERHERILVGIAAQAAIAIDNARLYQQARDAEYAARARAEELAAADRRKDDFLAMLAHELRNPLGAISNSIHVMSGTSPDRPAFRRALEVAVRQINHQTRLVDDLLDVSRIARGKIRLHLEQLDLAALARSTAEDHRDALEAAGVSLLLELPGHPVWVNGDRVRLAQVIGNLLDNARKFTPAGGKVGMRLALTAKQEAVLSVRDTGIGIDATVLPHLFTPFSQADRTLDRSQGGMGLGLSLVKGLVELHSGGSVRVTSGGPGRGAEFQITLPAEVRPDAREETLVSEPWMPAAVRVLVIEDIRDAAETLRDLLELFGCVVEVAFTGQEGIVRAAEFLPDVVLCDIGLPGGVTGYDVARQLRSSPATAACRLIALTGYGTHEDRRRSREAGFDLHLTKPIQPDQLQQALIVAERGALPQE